MANIKFKGNPAHTSGELPKVGAKAPNFKLVKNDMSEASLESYAGKNKVLNIFPSIDPDGHFKFPHLWPGQNPPVTQARRVG